MEPLSRASARHARGVYTRALLLLLPSLAELALPPSCKLQAWPQETYFSDGDVILGGSLALHSRPSSTVPSFTARPQPITCQGFLFRYYRDVLGMVFATEEINQNPDFLPNITLGFRIFDSCMSEIRAIAGALEFMSGTKDPVPGYRCQNQLLLAGIIGSIMSSLTVPIARITGVLHCPQISHSASLSTLSDKLEFPSFLRTIPGNPRQNIALARLTRHFGWTWVGLVVPENDLGLQGGQQVQQEIERSGGCVAFVERIHLRYSMEKVLRLVALIQAHPVTVIIVHSAGAYVKVLLETLYARNVTGKIWLFSAFFVLSPGVFAKQAWKILNGTLGLVLSTNHMRGFEDFLYHLHPSRQAGDIFTNLFWMKAFDCQWPPANGSQASLSEERRGRRKLCTGKERVDKTTASLFELDDLSYTYHIYLAVYSLAHALEALINCKQGHGPFKNRSCAVMNDSRPWQILHYLKHVKFKAPSGDHIFFDENGDIPASFDILNIQIPQNENFQLIKVGKIDITAPVGEEISLNMSAILWSDGTSKVPRSVCSESCPAGYRRAAREGEPACCFDCVICSPGEVSNETDMVACIKCSDHEWSNERRDRCTQKFIEFLSFEEPLGLLLTIAIGFLVSVTALVLSIFIIYRDTPIVGANNRALSYLLLLALLLCFLCSLIFIGQPRKLTCMLRQTVFGVLFSLSISSILAKTIIVIIAFKATNPNSAARKWLGARTPASIVYIATLVQIIFCQYWLIRAPPFPEMNTVSNNEKITFECNEGQNLFFYCMLGYLGVLATVSFLVAFLSRNLPGSFNEAKLIAFSMLVFVSVWVAFIPAYLSSRGKYMVAVEVFAILCSGAALLSCIFFPKCYIILLRPEINSRQYIVGKTQLGNKKH